jgi:hypothetical protein
MHGAAWGRMPSAAPFSCFKAALHTSPYSNSAAGHVGSASTQPLLSWSHLIKPHISKRTAATWCSNAGDQPHSVAYTLIAAPHCSLYDACGCTCGQHQTNTPTTHCSPYRLQELPRLPLQEVAREVGRPARQISKQLLEAYGQLQCGLRLEYFTPAQLLRILQQQCGRLGGITTLELANILDARHHRVFRDSGWVRQDQQQQLHDVLTAIPPAFGTLQSLDMSEAPGLVGCAAAAMAFLAPLSSCLSSLKLRVAASQSSDPLPPPALPHFAALRRLVITIISTMSKEDVARWLEALSSMPALVHLEVAFQAFRSMNVELWLPGLSRSTPQLTSLALGSTCGWDTAAVAVLEHGLADLKSLSISLDDDEEDLAVLGGVLPALAGRKGLTSLSLEQLLEHWELPQPVPASLQVADWTLDVSCHEGQQTVEWLLEALPCQTGLTSLTLCLPDGGAAAEVLHCSLLAMPPTLVRLKLWCDYTGFDAASVMDGISRQRGLEELCMLCNNTVEAWPQEAALKLAAMTQLRVLELICCSLPAGFMPVLAGLTGLRDLKLDERHQEEEAQLTDASLLCLHPLQHLTRLQLWCSTGVEGPGLAVVRQLGALHELDVTLEDEVVEQLHHWLLPLPARLRKLFVHATSGREVRVDGALLAAAKLHGCVVLDGIRTHSRAHLPW